MCVRLFHLVFSVPSSIFAVANNSLQGCHAMRHISTMVYSYCDWCISCLHIAKCQSNGKRKNKPSRSDIFILSALECTFIDMHACALRFAISCVNKYCAMRSCYFDDKKPIL